MKKVRYVLESIIVRLAGLFFRSLPPKLASDIGGFIAENTGIFSTRNRIARDNLARAMPGLNAGETTRIISDMWNNLGRTFAEFSHVGLMAPSDMLKIVSLEGLDNIRQTAASKKGAIYFTAHLANWEIGPRVFSDLGYPVSIVYRKGNNPYLADFVQVIRKNYLVDAIPKGGEGSRAIIRRLKNGERIGMLVDQKMNDGIETNFFNMPAMTAPAIARLAIRFECPVVPVRVIRENGFKFRLLTYPELDVQLTGNSELDTRKFMEKINAVIESWIREQPGQWIWLHNRWPDKI